MIYGPEDLQRAQAATRDYVFSKLEKCTSDWQRTQVRAFLETLPPADFEVLVINFVKERAAKAAREPKPEPEPDPEDLVPDNARPVGDVARAVLGKVGR